MFFQLQNKRELFFKNESSPAPALVTTVNSNVIPPSNGNSKIEIPPIHAKYDTLRSQQTSEDNREKESKEKIKIEKDKRRKELDGYVGFANLPNQVYRKAVKRGFDFTLMVVGKISMTAHPLIRGAVDIIMPYALLEYFCFV